MWEDISTSATPSPLREWHSGHTGWRMRAWRTTSDRAWSCSRAGQTCWDSATRTCSATAPSHALAMSASGWWIGDDRREVCFGDDVAFNDCAAGELTLRGALLDALHVQPA